MARTISETGTTFRAFLPIVALTLCALPLRADVLIERTFMPLGASPSSFAIGLPGGVNFCFDPVRASINYVWTGGFVDVTPARPGAGKFTSAVKLLGPIVYRETGVTPLRRGDPTRPSVVEFTGYTLRAGTIEFRYTVDGLPVCEEIRAGADGAGLIRRFRLASGNNSPWWHVVDGKLASELKRDPGGDAFILEITFGQPAP